MALELHIASINFNTNVADTLGSLWYVDLLSGWDSPPQRLSTATLPAQHGEVLVENVYNARNMTVGGVCKAKAQGGNTVAQNMYQSMYYLASETNATANRINFRVEEDIERYCAVYRAGEVRMSYIGVGAFRYEMVFRADDPMKYSWAQKSITLSSGTLINDGSVRTYPTITLNSGGNVTVNVNGRVWQGNGVPGGLVINTKQMTAKLGGTSYYDHVVPTSEWPFLEPGNNSYSANVSTTVAYRDAWV